MTVAEERRNEKGETCPETLTGEHEWINPLGYTYCRWCEAEPREEGGEMSAEELHRKALRVPLDYYAGTDWMTHGRAK